MDLKENFYLKSPIEPVWNVFSLLVSENPSWIANHMPPKAGLQLFTHVVAENVIFEKKYVSKKQDKIISLIGNSDISDKLNKFRE